MGSARWNPSDWDNYTTHARTKDRASIFTAHALNPDFDPRNIQVRESVDSAANPASTPIIVALDVTGSMGRIPEQLIKGSLGTFIEEIYHRKPVSDPHLMFMGVGDAHFDRAPLQVTQFEADLRIAEQLAGLYLEGGGGGNASESYHLPWYFAGLRTSIDSMRKRNKRGYLFTVGDEEAPPALTRDQIKRVLGDEVERDLQTAELLALAERDYHVFHVIVEEGSACRSPSGRAAVMASWEKLMPQRLVRLADHTKLSEVLVSTIAMNEGASATTVTASWSGSTQMVVAHALNGLMPHTDPGQGLVRF